MEGKQPIDLVYDAYQQLSNAGELVGEKQQDYVTILESVTGDVKVKTLAAQFIPKFMHHFPDLKDRALNAQLDLCEDIDQNIRLTAYRGLAIISQNSPDVVNRVADVLGQLLVLSDPKEILVVKQSFSTLLDTDIKNCLQPLLRQIQSGDDEAVREKAFEFLKENILSIRKKLNKDEETQKFVAEQILQIISTPLSEDRFKFFSTNIKQLGVFKTDPSISDGFSSAIIKLADLDHSSFTAANPESTSKFLSSLRILCSTNLGKDNNSIQKFFDFFYSQIVPQYDSIPSDDQTKLLKAIADTSRSKATSSDSEKFMVKHFNFLLDLCKNPDNSPTSFIKLECCLYIFHQFAARNSRTAKETAGVFIPTGQPDDFSDEISEKKKSFFTILDSALERISEYVKTIPISIKELKTTINADSTPEERKEYQNQLRNLTDSKSACGNIRELVKFLKQNRPSFVGPSSQFWLSFRAQNNKKNSSTPNEKKSDPKKSGKPSSNKLGKQNSGRPQGMKSQTPKKDQDNLPKRKSRAETDDRTSKKPKHDRSLSAPGRKSSNQGKSSSKKSGRRVVVVKGRK